MPDLSNYTQLLSGVIAILTLSAALVGFAERKAGVGTIVAKLSPALWGFLILAVCVSTLAHVLGTHQKAANTERVTQQYRETAQDARTTARVQAEKLQGEMFSLSQTATFSLIALDDVHASQTTVASKVELAIASIDKLPRDCRTQVTQIRTTLVDVRSTLTVDPVALMARVRGALEPTLSDLTTRVDVLPTADDVRSSVDNGLRTGVSGPLRRLSSEIARADQSARTYAIQRQIDMYELKVPGFPVLPVKTCTLYNYIDGAPVRSSSTAVYMYKSPWKDEDHRVVVEDSSGVKFTVDGSCFGFNAPVTRERRPTR